ncbi:MAG: alpha/beta hydrolase domain-containing protein [Burkholderiales bacterium]
MLRRLLCFLMPCALLPAVPADARLVRLEVESREIVADGQAFGAAGPYEKLRGRAFFEVDPGDGRNARVTDLGHAAVNRDGRVEFSADMMVLKPVDMRRASRTLVFEVNNRGRKIAFMRFHDTPSSANMNDPMAAADFGNGFLMRQGHVIAWVGWGADIAPGDRRLTVNFPIVLDGDKPATHRILTEFGDRNFNGGTPTTLPLSGSPAFHSFPAVATDKAAAEAELWVVASDSPRPSGPGIPRGERVPDDAWAFARCPDGWPGTPSVTDLCLKSGFRNDRNYHLLYRATRSPVMGLGYVTSRDFVSFLRHGKADDAGAPNPVTGIDTTLCLGISSSGMYLRDFLYQGFNEDEAGRRVCDGAHIHVAGVQKLFLNYRFAQPNPFTQQHRERYVPDTNFPHQYGVRASPVNRLPDGILKRPSSDPKLIHTDTSNEYWQFRASLTGTTEGGRMDLSDNSRVRRYLLSSLQHGGHKGDAPARGIGDRQCVFPHNPVHPGPMLRALFVALETWVRSGVAPPENQVPRIGNGTLVAPEDLRLPVIPGLVYRGWHNGSGERDFGPRVAGNAGIIDKPFPEILHPHRVLVPQVDSLGHDVAGIRHPFIEVPLATYLGWNTRTPEFGGDDLCDLLGSMIPLPATAAEAAAAGDSRPALERLYPDAEAYSARVEAAARGLVVRRLMLEEDVPRLVQEARAAFEARRR